jgi:hypothetical protein
MVAVRYVTVMCKILPLVHPSLYWFHWHPLYSKQGETCSLQHPEVECDPLFILHHLKDSRSRIAILIVKAVIQPECDQFGHATAPTTFGELIEIHDSVSRKLQCGKEPPGIG